MKLRKNNGVEQHYYSDRLKRKLNEMRFTLVTIIEAPSGYGKTTALRDFLETGVPENTPIYWFTAIDETPSAGFRRLCREIDKIDSHAGGRLLKIELPNAANIGEVCDALRSVRCRQETYLVLDNFQLLQTALMPSFFTALMDHGGEALHVVILTQMLGRDIHTAVAGRGFLHITASDLRLGAEDILRYYALADVNITLEDAHSVESCTEGWIVAVYLQLRAFRETGSFSHITILSLMEHLVWDVMTNEQQVFLMRLSPFETITYRQACVLIKSETLPVYAQEALKNPFIRYERVEQRYELHSILSQLLNEKRGERGVIFEQECLLKAGDLCRDEGRISEALNFYWRANDYERLMSLDFSFLIFEEIGDTPFVSIAMDIVQNCPEVIKRAFPLSMLRISWTLMIFGFHEAFDELMQDLREMLDLVEDRDDIFLLRGEWLLLTSFNHYPDLDEMTKILKKAADLFKGECSQVILFDSPWWFGSCTPLADFHITPGEADKEGEKFEKYVALFSKLTNGNGTGADALYRAVLAYHRGNIGEAEALAYKAVYLSESKKQSIIQLNATLQLAQVALIKADTEGWQHAINAMERAASYPSQNSFVVRSALDIMRGMLLIELQQLDGLADWLKKGDFSKKRLLPPMIPLAVFIHGLYLLHQGEIPRLIGKIEANLSKESIDKPINNMLLTLNLAAGYLHMENCEKAVALIRSTAQRVMPDRLVFTFASFSWLLQGLTDDIIEKECPELYDRFKEIKERFGSGWIKLYNDFLPEELPTDLTEREREVALLAARGKRNSEIAEELFISESTVRTHLRTIFKKLDIDRRIKLAEKFKN